MQLVSTHSRVISERACPAIRRSEKLAIFVREFWGKNKYAGQKLLSIRIGDGGGLDSAIEYLEAFFSVSSLDDLNDGLERAKEMMAGLAEPLGRLSQSSPEWRPNTFLLPYYLLRSTVVLSRALQPDFGCKEFSVELRQLGTQGRTLVILKCHAGGGLNMAAVLSPDQFTSFQQAVQHAGGTILNKL